MIHLLILFIYLLTYSLLDSFVFAAAAGAAL